MTTLEATNAALRSAVEARSEAQAAGVPRDEWYEPPKVYGHQGECCRGPSAAEVIERFSPTQLRPGSREFMDVLDELKDLHLRKTLDYGIDEDALNNIRSSADVVNMPAWAGCVLRMMDKMHRLKAFFRRGTVEFDGVEDTLKDIACYAAIALVLHREEGK